MYRFLSLLVWGGALGLGATIPAAAQYLSPTANLLLRYDIDQNGVVSQAEVDAGVLADFQLADLDGDSCIQGQEIRDENERRWARDAEVGSPISDWNLDGCVNLNEFGNTARNYFGHADTSNDGQVSSLELRGPSMPITLPTMPGQQATQEPVRTPIPAQQGTGSLQRMPNGEYDDFQYNSGF